jgi:hypothetical protein
LFLPAAACEAKSGAIASVNFCRKEQALTRFGHG